MKTPAHAPRLAAAGTVLLLCGCSGISPQTRMYVLHATEPAADETAASQRNGTAVAVASVEIPEYLDRPSIITGVDSGEITFSEFQRWASPLEDNIRQVLIENLSRLLRSDRVVPESRRSPLSADRIVNVRIIGFSGVLGETASLQARWIVSSADGNNLIAIRTFRKEIELPGPAYLDYVNAQSALLGDLSRDIAAALRTAR